MSVTRNYSACLEKEERGYGGEAIYFFISFSLKARGITKG